MNMSMFHFYLLLFSNSILAGQAFVKEVCATAIFSSSSRISDNVAGPVPKCKGVCKTAESPVKNARNRPSFHLQDAVQDPLRNGQILFRAGFQLPAHPLALRAFGPEYLGVKVALHG